MSLAQDMLDEAVRRVQEQKHTSWDDIGLLESLAAAAGLSQEQFYALLETLPSVAIQYGERMNPLERGYSRAAMGRNIEIEREHGKPAGQAAAIAYSEARKAFRAEHPGEKLPARLRRKRKRNPERLPYRVAFVHRGKTHATLVHAQNDDSALRYVSGPLFKRKLPKGARVTSLKRSSEPAARKKKSNPQAPLMPKKNRVPRLATARRAYRDFTGREASRVVRYKLPDGETGWALGPIPEIHYIATRDGETAHYVHKFRQNCRPLLATDANGSQLYVLGGAYRVTNAGITDR